MQSKVCHQKFHCGIRGIKFHAHIEGVLFSDFANGQNRAILNGVSINFKFFQSTNPFRLLRHGTKAYKLKITDAIKGMSSKVSLWHQGH